MSESGSSGLVRKREERKIQIRKIVHLMDFAIPKDGIIYSKIFI